MARHPEESLEILRQWEKRCFPGEELSDEELQKLSDWCDPDAYILYRFDRRRCIEIVRIGVLLRHRHKGVARAFLTRFLDLHDGARIKTYTRYDNWPAMRLFTWAGFKPGKVWFKVPEGDGPFVGWYLE